jgi:Protein of unknown function (DUF1634)
MASPLERTIETALTAGLAASATLLVAGLAGGWPQGVRFGIILLMLTPVVRVVVLTAGLFLRRDWLFGTVSLLVLAVLLSGIAVSLRITAGRATAPRASSP